MLWTRGLIRGVSKVQCPCLLKVIKVHRLQIHSSAISHNKMSEYKEVQIPVPWGHIAGKEWGEGSEVWIVLHGWLDNCASFDPLIKNHFPLHQHKLIAFDIPGHGFSSHYPKGFPYHYMDGVQYIKRVASHYKLSSFNLMGHSMGAGISLVYAATFPEEVKRLVQLDGLKPISRRDPTQVVEQTREHFSSLMTLESKPERIIPTFEEARERQRIGIEQISGKEGCMTEAGLDALSSRSIKAAPEGGFVFTRDIRHRIRSLHAMETHLVMEFVKRVRCPHLSIKADKRQNYERPELWDQAVKLCQESNPQGFTQEIVDGFHHVHLTHPQRVWPHIEHFLAKSNI